MKHWIEHDDAGRILMATKSDMQRPVMGGAVIEVDKLHSPVDDYVTAGQARPRPACPAVLDGLVLRHLPLPCTLIVAGDVHELPADGDNFAELDFTYPGTYRVQVQAWPHLDGEFEVVKP